MPLGRVVFTHKAMPAIRPVNHLLDGKTVVIRSHLGAAVTGHAAGDGAVACYEADDIDSARHTGWSVIVTGMARLVREPAVKARYERLLSPGRAARWTTSSRSRRRSSPVSGSSAGVADMGMPPALRHHARRAPCPLA